MNPWLHRCALLMVVLAIAAIVAGALITSTGIAARQAGSTVLPVVDVAVHRGLAIALTFFAIGLAIWVSSAPTRGWLRAVAWTGVATLVLDGIVGWSTPPLAATAGVLHALLAHLFFALSVAMAAGTSAGWNGTPELVDGSRKPLLRPLAMATPPVVLMQIVLGATYRHEMTSIMPHMGVAMAVAFAALIGSSVVLQNFPRPASLRRAAAALISIVLTQVCLGIGAFLMLLLNYAGSLYFVAITIAHVLVGASTLAASVVLAMQIWRCVRPRAAGVANSPA
jgi:heme A synthase